MENGMNLLERCKSWPERAARVLDLWRQRARYRRELAQLDVRAIKDMGLTTEFVQWESTKMFWQK
jgi:uncharacterized protein YjiS (DUF1127 family)